MIITVTGIATFCNILQSSNSLNCWLSNLDIVMLTADWQRIAKKCVDCSLPDYNSVILINML